MKSLSQELFKERRAGFSLALAVVLMACTPRVALGADDTRTSTGSAMDDTRSTTTSPTGSTLDGSTSSGSGSNSDGGYGSGSSSTNSGYGSGSSSSTRGTTGTGSSSSGATGTGTSSGTAGTSSGTSGATMNDSGSGSGGYNTDPNMSPDNSGVNERDRGDRGLEATDQANTQNATDITARIRRAVTDDDSLSMNARNVKIITANGRVTLRGPVNSETERQKVAAMAKKYSGGYPVVNELEVTRK